jgi:hypothetical protein
MRFETSDGKTFINYPSLTPVTGYTNMTGFHIARLSDRVPDFELIHSGKRTTFWD